MIITEVGNPEMNSYVSPEEAANYFYQRSHGEAWEDITNYEAFLITASNQLDWYVTFLGNKINSSQVLEWPRENVFDEKDQVNIESNIIPLKVKYAVFELILSSLDEDRVSESDMLGLQEVKVGSLKVVSNLIGPWQGTKTAIPDVVYKILDGIIKNTGSMFRPVIRT